MPGNVLMPELDGYQVLEHIRSDPSRSGSLVDKLTARRASRHAAFMSIPEVSDPPGRSVKRSPRPGTPKLGLAGTYSKPYCRILAY